MPARKSPYKAINNPTSRIPVPAGKHKTQTGAASSKADKTKIAPKAAKAPQTELQNLESLRSKMEKSVDAFIVVRKELEEILPAESSSEQGRFSSGSSADLMKELKRNGELTSRVSSSLKGNPDKHIQGPVMMGGSYKFLKSIMG